MKAVDAPVDKALGRPHQPGRCHVAHHPACAHGLAFGPNLLLRQPVGRPAGPERRSMDEREVREVEQIVDQEQVIGLDIMIAVNGRPLRRRVRLQSGRSAGSAFAASPIHTKIRS